MQFDPKIPLEEQDFWVSFSFVYALCFYLGVLINFVIRPTTQILPLSKYKIMFMFICESYEQNLKIMLS